MITYPEWEAEFKKWQKDTRTTIIGKHMILLAEIPSTNTYIKTHEQLKHGTIVAAYTQSQGKGQKNRTWISNPGGLYLSIKLDINTLKYSSPFWVTATVSIGLCSAINKLGLEATIKWPNDILVNGKKVAGVLTETVLSSDSIIAVIGVGCNVNNSLNEIFTSFPELRERISSLLEETTNKTSIPFHNILEPTIYQVEHLLLSPNSFSLHEIKQKWVTYAKIINKRVTLEKLDTHEIIKGEVENITDSGSLIIVMESGKREEYTSGDIKTVT